MTVVAFLLLLALTARFTRLATVDSITAFARDWFAKVSNPGGLFVAVTTTDPINNRTITTQQSWAENPQKFRHRAARFLFELTDCPWCTSVWVAGVALTTAAATHQIDVNWFYFCGYWAALAYLTGLVSSFAGVLHNLENRDY